MSRHITEHFTRGPSDHLVITANQRINDAHTTSTRKSGKMRMESRGKGQSRKKNEVTRGDLRGQSKKIKL